LPLPQPTSPTRVPSGRLSSHASTLGHVECLVWCQCGAIASYTSLTWSLSTHGRIRQSPPASGSTTPPVAAVSCNPRPWPCPAPPSAGATPRGDAGFTLCIVSLESSRSCESHAVGQRQQHGPLLTRRNVTLTRLPRSTRRPSIRSIFRATIPWLHRYLASPRSTSNERGGRWRDL
jgi:hypothetical protein